MAKSPKRYLIFVAVAGAHAVVLGMLFSKSRSISQSSPTTIPITAFILTRSARMRPSITRPQLYEPSPQPFVQPVAVAPPAIPVRGPGSPAIDWGAQANRSVARILARAPGIRLSFGFPAGGESAIALGVPSRSTPHYAGESYRTETGEEIIWTSDHCYLVSEPPSLFAPASMQHDAVTRPICR